MDDKEKAKLKPKHYIDNKKFRELILKYYETDEMDYELGVMLNNISTHLAYRANFTTYTYLDDMISDGNYKMVKALQDKKFDPTKGSPFSYFSKICYRAFVNIIKKQKHKHILLAKYQDAVYDELHIKGMSNFIGQGAGEEEEEGDDYFA